MSIPAVQAIRTYIDAYEDAPSWGGPTMYPSPPNIPDLKALISALEAAEQENERLRKMVTGEWFYPADSHESESCHYSPDEVIDYHDLPAGNHVVEVNVATSLPSIWCAVRVTADEDADERYTFTEHANEEQARLALQDGEGGAL